MNKGMSTRINKTTKKPKQAEGYNDIQHNYEKEILSSPLMQKIKSLSPKNKILVSEYIDNLFV